MSKYLKEFKLEVVTIILIIIMGICSKDKFYLSPIVDLFNGEG